MLDRASIAHSSAKPIPYSEAQRVKDSLSADRLSTFHTSRRILIVDDNPRTAERLRRDLSILYDGVEVCTSPSHVSDVVRDAATDRRPFDAMVLDLYMPEMLGTEVIKNLGRSIPAVVINTASMMSPEMSDLRVQIDRYQSSKALSLYSEYAVALSAQHLPVVPILFHHKLEPLSSLVDAVDGAMLIKNFSHQGAEEFLAAFEPKLVVHDISSDMVHSFCEEIGNLTRELEPLIKHLKSEYRLSETSWYRRSGIEFEEAFSHLREARFTNTLRETPLATASRLHDLLFNVQLISPPELSQVSMPDSPAQALLEGRLLEWAKVLQKYQDIARRVRDSFEQYHGPKFDPISVVPKLVRGVQCEVYHLNRDDDEYPPLPDEDRWIRSFLPTLLETLSSREGRLSVTFLPETTQRSLEPKELARYQSLNCGDCYRISWNDSNPEKLETHLQSLAPLFAELTRRQLGFFWLYQEESSAFFELYLKVADKKIDFEKEAKEKARKKDDGTYVLSLRYEDIAVAEDLGEKRDIVVLRNASAHQESGRLMMYQFEHTRIISTGPEHFNSAWAIGEYIRHILRSRGEEVSDVHYQTPDLYRDGVRATIIYGQWLVEAREEDPNSAWAIDLVRQLGVEEERIRLESLGVRAR